jgi:ubiquinone/menaquinone biosynthesis C-methylase UbiE
VKDIQNWKPSRVISRKKRFTANIDEVTPSSYYIIRALLLELVDMMERNSKGIALDCGCGKVPYYAVYSKKIDNLFCIDWPNSSHQNAHVDYFLDLSTDSLPFSDNFFDTIYLNDVLEHIFNPFHLLSELKRVLTDKGCIIISVPFMYQIHEQPYDYFRYTQFFFQKWASQNSMQILEIKEYGGRFDIFIDNFHKLLYQKIKLSKFFIKFSSDLLLNSWLRKYINSTGKINFPLGYCLVLRKV